MKRAVVAVVFGGCLAAFLGGQYLSWDASYQLFYMLQRDEFFVFKDRWSMQLFQAPARLAAGVTDDLSVAVYAYGLLYSFVPAVCVALLARILAERTDLFVLAVVGICASTLLYQYHFLAEHLIACQVQWVLLALAWRNRRTAGATVALGATATVIFGLHPVAALLLGIAAVMCLLRDPGAVYNRVVAAVLGVGAVGRLLLLGASPGDQRLLNVHRLAWAVSWGEPITSWIPERNLPLLYVLLCSLAVGGAAVPALRRRRASWLRWVLLGAAAACLFAWFHDSGRNLIYALRLRHFTFATCLVPYGAFLWLSLRPDGARVAGSDRPAAAWLSPAYGLAAALLLFAFMTDVSVARKHQLAAAHDWLRGSGAACRTRESYTRTNPTLLEHWAMTYELLLYARTRRPKALLVDGRSCDFEGGQRVQLTRFAVAVERDGYFDLTEVVPPPDGAGLK